MCLPSAVAGVPSRSNAIERMKRALQEYHITEKELREAIGDYVAILRYADLLTKSASVSEKQLRKSVRDMFEMDNVTGSFVRFDSALFADQIGSPAEDTLQKHFETYKHFTPGQTGENNPYGFGYLLPVRLRRKT